MSERMHGGFTVIEAIVVVVCIVVMAFLAYFVLSV